MRRLQIVSARSFSDVAIRGIALSNDRSLLFSGPRSPGHVSERSSREWLLVCRGYLRFSVYASAAFRSRPRLTVRYEDQVSVCMSICTTHPSLILSIGGVMQPSWFLLLSSVSVCALLSLVVGVRISGPYQGRCGLPASLGIG